MVRPREFDEAEVLDQAVEVFWSRGYEGTSISDLEAATGLGRQSLYNAFGGKKELFARAVERYRTRADAHRRAIPEAGLAAVRSFFETSVEFLSTEGAGRGCFLGRVRLDAAAVEVAGSSCDRSEGSIRSFLVGHLVAAREAGELPPSVDPTVAAGLLSTLSRGISAAVAAGEPADSLRAEVELALAALASGAADLKTHDSRDEGGEPAS